MTDDDRFRALRRIAGFSIEIGFAATLIAAWATNHPRSSEYGSDGVVFLAALLVCLFSGWHLLGGWGCLVGCAVQLLRFGALATLFVLALSAYNPHMDNGCNDSGNLDACVERAQRNFRWLYFVLSGATVASALSLVVYASRNPVLKHQINLAGMTEEEFDALL